MPVRDAPDQFRTGKAPNLSEFLGHELLGPVGIGATALHDLDEASLVGVALHINSHVSTVTERGPALKQLLGLSPPLVLLRPLAVASGRLLGLEADDHDEPAVFGRSACRPEPASRAWGEIPHPLVGGGAQRLRVRCPALNHLSEHVNPPLGVSVEPDRLYLGRYDRRMLASIGPSSMHGQGQPALSSSLDARAATQPGRRLPTLMGLSSAVVRTGKRSTPGFTRGVGSGWRVRPTHTPELRPVRRWFG
jgi:hypothetical protein